LEFILTDRNDYPLELFPIWAQKIHVPAAFALSDLLKQDFVKGPPIEDCLFDSEFVPLAVPVESKHASLNRWRNSE